MNNGHIKKDTIDKMTSSEYVFLVKNKNYLKLHVAKD